jgi:hypothetical protein
MANSADSREVEFPEPKREAEVLQRALAALEQRLPPTWRMAADERPPADRGVDAVLHMRAPDGTERALVVEAKRLVGTRDVPAIVSRLNAARRGLGLEEAVPLLVARYLAPATRDRITEEGAAYADATGNLRIEFDRPALFVRDAGAARDPWRGPGRPRGTLQGPPAARVVRGLIDFPPPYTVPELAERTGASTGATYRVVDFVEELGLLGRERRGPIRDVKWRRLLERWSDDYGFARSNTVTTFLEPRGLRALADRLRDASDLRHVVTGSMAAARLAPWAEPRLATLYVTDPAQAAERLGLRDADRGANVALAAGDYEVVFQRAVASEGIVYAAPSQVAVDLLSGPGRSPGEAEALLRWMEANERDWRR